MKERVEIITESSLAARLTKETLQEVSPRLIGDWRRKELLPAFDTAGSGLGKGQGKTKSGWLDKQTVIDQAKWILRLRKLYPSLDELYFPLWVMEFPVPIEYVHIALCEPLDGLIEGLEETSNQWGFSAEANRLSDVVSDAVTDMSPMFKALRTIDRLTVPPDVVEAGMNVFVNPDYDLDGIDFSNSRLTYNKWKRRSHRIASNPNSTQTEVLIAENGSDHPIDYIFGNAPFLKENLSLHHLQRMMANCTDHLLEEVRQDLTALKKVVVLFGEFTQPLIDDLQRKWGPDSSDDALPQLFSLAKLVAWSDISLRQKGYAELIDQLRVEVPKRIESDLSASKGFENAEIRRAIVDAFEKGMAEMAEVFSELPLNK